MGRSVPSSLGVLLAVALAASLAACGALEGVRLPGSSHAASTEGEKPPELPTTVAVMPFANDTQEADAPERMRKSFYNFFASAPYVDVEPAAVDEGLARLERSTGEKAADMKPQEICQALGCDGLVYGKVTDYQKTFGGVYSRLRAEVEIWMVNTRTGKEVARVRDSVDYLEGGIPFSPLSAIMSAMTSAANLREVQETRMVSELAAKLVAKLPAPAGAATIKRPTIAEVITNAAESPFASGKIIRVGLQGDAGGIAMFDIGNFRKGLPMRETQPGVYLGEYAVLPGDDTENMPIIVTLRRPTGAESQWIDASGLVAIDTSAPQRVDGVKATGFRDRVEISWQPEEATPDLAAYRVLRSEHPLTGFAPIATTEFNAYEDRTPKPGVAYYYRVVAVDAGGNASEPSATVSAQLTLTARPGAAEASMLSGEAAGDTLLSGIYVLNGQFTVPAGVTLEIGPGTSILADKDAGIVVQGTLSVDGTADLVRLFSRRADRWAGIVIDGGHVAMKGAVVSGARTGLALKGASGMVENVSIVDNDVGVSVSGLSGAIVRNCWVAGNGTGVALAATDAKLVQSTIVRNATGLSLADFSGEVSENVIVDNGQNIVSDHPLKLGPNYIGRLRGTPLAVQRGF